MEFLLVFLLAFGFFIVLPIYLWVQVEKLKKAVAKVNQPTEAGRGVSRQAESMSEKPEPSETAVLRPEGNQTAGNEIYTPTPAPASTISYAPSSVNTGPGVGSRFMDWLKEDFIVKLGAFLLLLALGWFVSYAFANNWIGPIGRITLGILFGLAVVGVGIWRIEGKPQQGSIFTVLGATIIAITIFAAREIYDFFTPFVALAILFLNYALVTFVSLRYHRNGLALAGLILGAFAPLFTNAPEPDIAGLFAYLLVITFSSLWVVYMSGSRWLTPTALLIMIIYSLPFVFSFMSQEDEFVGLIYAFVFTGIFFVTNILSLISNANDQKARFSQLVTAFGTGLYLIVWVAATAPDHWQSLLYVAWMLVYACGGFIVYLRTTNHQPFYIYSATALALLAAATAKELDGHWLTIAYVVELSALVLLTTSRIKNHHLASRLSWLFVGPIILGLEHLDNISPFNPNWGDDLLALFILVIGLLTVGLSLLKASRTGVSTDNKTGVVWLYVGGAYALALIWQVTHVTIDKDMATFLSLIIYTIIGLYMFIHGKHHSHKGIKFAGGLVLGLVVLRLLTVEVWQMGLVGRIITFFSIGILFVSTAFIKSAVKEK